MENLSNNINDKKILFTGGSGRLGKACKKIFPKAQYPIKEELNILDRKSICKYLLNNEVEIVIHLAAMASIPKCEENKEMAYQMNVEGTRNILEGTKIIKVKHFIYLNTACIFLGASDDKLEDEDSLPNPKHYYGLTKYI